MTWEAIESGAGGMPFSLVAMADGFAFLSGHASVDENGNIVGGTFEEEMRRALGNLESALRSAGCGFGDVVKVTGYVRDAANLPAYNEIYREYFSDPFPARTTLTNCLPESLHFEIDAIARLP